LTKGWCVAKKEKEKEPDFEILVGNGGHY